MIKEIKIDKVKVMAKLAFIEGADTLMPLNLMDTAVGKESELLGYVVQIELGDFKDGIAYVINEFQPDQLDQAKDFAKQVRIQGCEYAEGGNHIIRFLP